MKEYSRLPDYGMAKSTWLVVAVLLQFSMFTLVFISHMLDQSVPDDALSLSIPYAISKAAGTALHVNIVILLLVVCHSLRWILRNTVGRVTNFDDGTTTHHFALCSILAFSLVHASGKWAVFAQISIQQNYGARGMALLNFATGVGWTGHVMLIALILTIASLGIQPKDSWFWSLVRSEHFFHGLFFALWAAHEVFCVPDWTLDSFSPGSDIFWLFWITGSLIYLIERMLLLKLRSTQKAQIIKVIQHPNAVFEIQFEKVSFKATAGQHVILSCPTVSLTEKRRFPLTSAPEEDFLSIHLRVSDKFSQSFASALCYNQSQKDYSTIVSVEQKNQLATVSPSICKVLPQICFYGPIGCTANRIFNSEIAILVGVEEGVTPFASILKSIWYRMNHPRHSNSLQKVYFFWICHDFDSFEWFRSLLMAIEMQDIDSRIEIYPYLIAPFNEADATKHMINSAVQGSDVVTGLRTPTRHGQPCWDEILADVTRIHAPIKTSFLYCGPPHLSVDLERKCKMATERSVGAEFSFLVEQSDF